MPKGVPAVTSIATLLRHCTKVEPPVVYAGAQSEPSIGPTRAANAASSEVTCPHVMWTVAHG